MTTLEVSDTVLSALGCCRERERHVNGRCFDCPYDRHGIHCMDYMFSDAIEMIEHLQTMLKNEKEAAE